MLAAAFPPSPSSSTRPGLNLAVFGQPGPDAGHHEADDEHHARGRDETGPAARVPPRRADRPVKACWLMPTSATSAWSYRVKAQLELPGA
jgi:hypothetical protein